MMGELELILSHIRDCAPDCVVIATGTCMRGLATVPAVLTKMEAADSRKYYEKWVVESGRVTNIPVLMTEREVI